MFTWERWADFPTWVAGLLLRNPRVTGVWLLLAGLSGVVPAQPAPESATNNVAAVASVLDPQFGVGSWIWDEETHDLQECHLWRAFEIPEGAAVKQARLRITADNFNHLFLDGQEMGWGSDWYSLIEYDLSLLLKPGTHVLAVIGFNDFEAAGVLLGLRVELTDGRVIEIASDQNWRVVPNDERNWEEKTRASPKWQAAKIVGAFGSPPWEEKSRRAVYHAHRLQPIPVQFWQHGWFQITLASLCAAVLLVCLYLASRLLLQSRAQIVMQRERARIARDIHDDLTAGLTKLVLLGETTRNDLPNGSETHAQVGQICDRTRGLMGGMNEVVWLINSQRDTLQDFTSYLCKCAETFLAPTPIRCRFDVGEEMPAAACDVGIRRNLLLGVKEALNNVVRHSQAKEVFLRIHRRGNEVVISVEDDGKGFDPASADRERNGLSNLMRRASEAGGVCRIVSRPGAGCRIEFRVPLARPRRFPGRLRALWGLRGMGLGLLLIVLCGGVSAAEVSGPGTHEAGFVGSVLDPKFGVGSWIWDKGTHERQECHLWRTFEIPAAATVKQARLRITAHNSYHLLLDGQDLGWGSNWRSLIEYDVSLLLKPGTHVLAVSGFNDFHPTGVLLGGVLLGLRVELTDGRVIEVGSDQSWRVVPNDERRWEKKTRASPKWQPATVVGALGNAPWGEGARRTIFHAPIPEPTPVQFWQHGWFQITLASLCAAIILVCLYLASRLLLQSQAQQVVQRERARIARDIHDDLTAGLTELVLLGETARNHLPNNAETRTQVGQICEETRSLLRAMNEIVWLINSQRDTLRDFASYVCKCAETFLAPTPIRCRFDIGEDMPAVPCDVGIRRNLFLGVKEALNNVVRHSQAKEVFLRIHRRGQDIAVSIEDDGSGFDPAAADRQRNGLSNMMRRAAEAGGVCRIVSRPGAGCRVEFQVPLARERRFWGGLRKLWGSLEREPARPVAWPRERRPAISKPTKTL